jgi:hypothetical protein
MMAVHPTAVTVAARAVRAQLAGTLQPPVDLLEQPAFVDEYSESPLMIEQVEPGFADDDTEDIEIDTGEIDMGEREIE